MTEVFNTVLEEGAFLQVQRGCLFVGGGQVLVDMVNVVFNPIGKYNNVIKVYSARFHQNFISIMSSLH